LIYDYDLSPFHVLNPFQELVLGFVDYTSGEAANWDNVQIDVVHAFERFDAASNPEDAESFLRKHLFNHSLEDADTVDSVISNLMR
jgi:hypothetical protein